MRTEKVIRFIYVALGSIFVALAILGIFLPLLPTTPFLLLAAACYAKGSARFYEWLIEHKWLGPYVKPFRSGKGMPLRAKVVTLALMWLAMSTSAIFFIEPISLIATMAAVGIGVTIYLLRMPTFQLSESEVEAG
ncbi:protein of unknown function DUF454 [Chloroherpeton thalassium ATCC 35110]|uniref:DUF454 domain-containing protein n=1 Tax=Chloroherpeton thalassium (strain ATCC 35110 / GB-78) TaxID=517418 RepID=B3QY05_CHLT3|nr:YbaN family protein [Chloroherpeton thalassium]ACF13533.1 protein of unknown function DUF454 [Chloroherpeton thalassium ATCC 35110]